MQNLGSYRKRQRLVRIKEFLYQKPFAGGSGGGGRNSTDGGTGQEHEAGFSAEAELNDSELANFKRFEKKLPNASKVTMEKLHNGNKVFKAEVHGKVPGSKASYEKTVNSKGETISYYKTTYALDGSIIHIKDKINNIQIK